MANLDCLLQHLLGVDTLVAMCSLYYTDRLQCQLLATGELVSRSTGLVPRRTQKILGAEQANSFGCAWQYKRASWKPYLSFPSLKTIDLVICAEVVFPYLPKSWTGRTHTFTFLWRIPTNAASLSGNEKIEPNLCGTLQKKCVINHKGLFCCNIFFLQMRNFCFS